MKFDMIELEHVSDIISSVVGCVVVYVVAEHIWRRLSDQPMQLDCVDPILIPPACDNI